LTDPAEQENKIVVLADGRHVELLMVVPAFADELDFAPKRGVDELLDVMTEQRTPFWNPDRRSVFADQIDS
jgi:hypothetical protein